MFTLAPDSKYQWQAYKRNRGGVPPNYRFVVRRPSPLIHKGKKVRRYPSPSDPLGELYVIPEPRRRRGVLDLSGGVKRSLDFDDDDEDVVTPAAAAPLPPLKLPTVANASGVPPPPPPPLPEDDNPPPPPPLPEDDNPPPPPPLPEDDDTPPPPPSLPPAIP